MGYKEEEYLQLSGIQHFLFCRRQWALIHLEQQWAENYRTTDGELMHKNAHDDRKCTSRGELFILSGMHIHSPRLGLSGTCDVVEFRQNKNGILLHDKPGLWLPYPVEYKRGRAKPDTSDEAQLCAEAMCLEEMLCCEIAEGALYYGETRHRQVVTFTPELRALVERTAEEMHQLYRRGCTPRVRPQKGCQACSLNGLCLPKLLKKRSVAEYMSHELGESS